MRQDTFASKRNVSLCARKNEVDVPFVLFLRTVVALPAVHIK